jgi:ankyrin repeat protein
MLTGIQGNVPMAALLLEKGADPTRKNAAGRTAVDLARENGHPEVAALVEHTIRK